MLAATVWTGMPENTVEASEGAATEVIAEHTDITTADIPEGYKWLTASDFHSGGNPMVNTWAPSSSYIGQQYIHDMSSTLNKTVFAAKVHFPSGGDNRIYFGGEWNNFYFRGLGDNIVLRTAGDALIKEFTPEAAGCQLTGNVDLEFTVSFEFINTGETKTDVKIGVFFKDNLYNDEYIIVEGLEVAKLKQRIAVDVWAGSSLTIANAQVLAGTYLKDYTTTSIGLVRGQYNQKSLLEGSSVAGTIFGTRIAFTESGSSCILFYGGTGGYNGLAVYVENNGKLTINDPKPVAGVATNMLLNASGSTYYAEFDAATHLGEGYTTFLNQTFDLHISTEVVNHDNGSTADDIRFGIWINGKLGNGTYYYSYNAASYLGESVAFQNTIPTFAATGAISGEAVRTDLEQLSTDDITATYGTSWGGTSYTYALHPSHARYGKYEAASNFDGKTFGANVTLSHNSSQTFFQVGGSDEWSTGIRFKANGANLIIESGGVTSTTITPDFIGKDTFNGTPITIWVSTEVANLDGGDAENDVKYTVYIEGKLYTVLYAMNYASSLSNGVVFTNWDGGSTFSAAKKTTETVAVPEDKTPISFSDFEIANGKYENVLGKMGTYTGEFEEILGTVFTGYVTYSSTHSSVGETRKHGIWTGATVKRGKGSGLSEVVWFI